MRGMDARSYVRFRHSPGTGSLHALIQTDEPVISP